MTRYLRDISTIIDKMNDLIPEARAANRNKLYNSYEIIWMQIASMTSTFKPFNLRPFARQQFQDYVAAEERRIYENLCKVKFRIDDFSTLVLVTGPGRIEQVSLLRSWNPALVKAIHCLCDSICSLCYF